MIKMLAAGVLSISVLSGCSTKFFSLPDKFDICGVDIGELTSTDDFPNNLVYIRVGWCAPSLLPENEEND